MIIHMVRRSMKRIVFIHYDAHVCAILTQLRHTGAFVGGARLHPCGCMVGWARPPNRLLVCSCKLWRILGEFAEQLVWDADDCKIRQLQSGHDPPIEQHLHYVFVQRL